MHTFVQHTEPELRVGNIKSKFIQSLKNGRCIHTKFDFGRQLQKYVTYFFEYNVQYHVLYENLVPVQRCNTYSKYVGFKLINFD